MNDDHDLLIMLLLLAMMAVVIWIDHVDGPILGPTQQGAQP
ncbi:hypothetical protein [Stutzerimonas balearica]|nr:hypothetical protein [Stutzerimonas balearica]